MQASFQRHYDEGVACDHTHKYGNAIHAGSKRQRVFTASYTVTSLTGHFNLCRLTMTKGMGEIDNIVAGYKKARAKVNAPQLKHFSSDNLKGDGSTWRRHFGDELSEGVTPYKKPSKGFPTLDISISKINYLTNVGSMNNVAQSLVELYSNSSGNKVIYGLYNQKR